MRRMPAGSEAVLDIETIGVSFGVREEVPQGTKNGGVASTADPFAFGEAEEKKLVSTSPRVVLLPRDYAACPLTWGQLQRQPGLRDAFMLWTSHKRETRGILTSN